MPDTWENEMGIELSSPPIYLTQAERYMLFAVAEQLNVSEREALKRLIEQAYSTLD